VVAWEIWKTIRSQQSAWKYAARTILLLDERSGSGGLDRPNAFRPSSPGPLSLRLIVKDKAGKPVDARHRRRGGGE